jgi:hypothetical protein
MERRSDEDVGDAVSDKCSGGGTAKMAIFLEGIVGVKCKWENRKAQCSGE